MAPPTVCVPDQPGWSGVSAPPLHALWHSEDERLADEVRAAARTGDLEEVLDVLSSAGVRRTPDFVAVLEGEPLRVVTRGVAYAAGSGPLGTVELRAGGRGPWDDLDAPQHLDRVELCPGAPVAQESPARPAAAAPTSAWRAPNLFSRERTGPATEAQPDRLVPGAGEGSPEPPTPGGAPAAPDPGRQPEAELEDLPSYDHLFGATEHVRPRPRMIDPHDTQGLSEPPIGHTHHESAGGYVPREPDTGGLTLPPPTDTARPPADNPAGPHDAPKPAQGALIESVPWRSGGSDVPPAPAANRPSPAPVPSPPAPEPASPPTVPTAPVTGQPPSLPSPAPSAANSGAEDPEATVDRSALLAAQGAATAHAGPTVLAVLCPAGHTSPPHAGSCRVCQRPIPPQQPFQTPRPPLGTLRLSTGDVVTLDRGVLLGRSPKVNADLPAGDRPHLVRVPSPENDISRNHVEVVLEGWHVLVRDLGSTNGTTLTLPGQPPVRVRPGDSQVIEAGTVVTLADEVTLTFEVAPA